MQRVCGCGWAQDFLESPSHVRVTCTPTVPVVRMFECLAFLVIYVSW